VLQLSAQRSLNDYADFFDESHDVRQVIDGFIVVVMLFTVEPDFQQDSVVQEFKKFGINELIDSKHVEDAGIKTSGSKYSASENVARPVIFVEEPSRIQAMILEPVFVDLITELPWQTKKWKFLRTGIR
jgi:hypothetical protein